MDISSSTKITVIVVFIVYTVCLLLLGWRGKRALESGGNAEYTKNFFTGGKGGMSSLLIAMMVAAGICSAGTFIGSPGTTYKIGMTWSAICLGQSLMNLMVLGVFGKKIAIVSKRENVQSYVGLYYARFQNKILSILITIIILLFLSYYTAAQFIGGGRLFEVMTGLPYWVGVLAFTVVVLVITSFGGIKGVAVGTVFQGTVMTIATIFLVVLGVRYCGGEAAFRNLTEVNPSLVSGTTTMSPAMILSYWLLSGFFVGCLPHAAIGCIGTKSTRAMNSSITIGILVVSFWSVALSLVAGEIRSAFPDLPVADYAMPVLAIRATPAWVAGLTLAGVVGALQSTVGTMVIVMSGAIVKDVYQQFIKPDASEKTMKTLTRTVTIVVCIVILIFSLTPPDNLQVIVVLAVSGMVSCLFAPLFLGLYWKRANQWGALASMIGGLVVFLLNATKIVDWTMGMQPAIIGVIASLILMVVVSLITPKTPYGVIQRWFGEV